MPFDLVDREWGQQLRAFAALRSADRVAVERILAHRCSAPDAPFADALGLDTAELRPLLAQCFPGTAEQWDGRECVAHLFGPHRCPTATTHMNRSAGPRPGEADQSGQDERDLFLLLLSHRADNDPIAIFFARAIARACITDDELWTSLGLSTGGQLDGLLARQFPTLAKKNTRGLPWKSFLQILLQEADPEHRRSSAYRVPGAQRGEFHSGTSP